MSEIQTIRKGVIYSEYTIYQHNDAFWWEAGGDSGYMGSCIESEREFSNRTDAEADIIRTFGSL